MLLVALILLDADVLTVEQLLTCAGPTLELRRDDGRLRLLRSFLPLPDSLLSPLIVDVLDTVLPFDARDERVRGSAGGRKSRKARRERTKFYDAVLVAALFVL
jgi:hypothetical protein